MTHCITLLLSTGKSEIKLLLVPGTVGIVLVYFNCCVHYVCWASFILVGQFALGNIFACLCVAGGWLSLAITIITAYLKTSNSCLPRYEDAGDLILGQFAMQSCKYSITLITL